jgi:hypothetical protein
VLDILTDSVRFEAEWRKAQEIERDALAPKRERLEVIHELIAHCEARGRRNGRSLEESKGAGAG